MGYRPPPPMGQTPIPPYIVPTSAADFLAQNERSLVKDVEKGRRSWLPWRRRAALEAMRTLTEARLAVLGLGPDPWVLRAPPKPSDARRALPIAPDPDLVKHVELI